MSDITTIFFVVCFLLGAFISIFFVHPIVSFLSILLFGFPVWAILCVLIVSYLIGYTAGYTLAKIATTVSK